MGAVICELNSRVSNHSIKIRAHIMKQLTSQIPKSQISTCIQNWPHLEGLKFADPTFAIPQQVDILLGADFYGQIIRPEIIYHSSSSPIAQKSIFGWLVLGPVEADSYSYHHQISYVISKSEDQAIQQLLAKFWTQEEIPMTDKPLLSQAEQQCEELFRTTHSRHSSGRYIVRIPLIASPSTLGVSYNTALHCLKRQLSRLSSDSEYSNLYRQFMSEYEQLGHMRPAPTDTQLIHTNNHQYFLPHHGVLRPSSTTTKLRVVFNGSSPSSTGISLNDITHTGAKIQLDIFDVLLWIRQHQFVFATDITKMYRQIMVHPDDWKLQQILWLDNQRNIIPYQLTTVTYGTRSAPFLAVRVLLQLVEDEGHQYPKASQAILKGRYVDDIFGGGESHDELIQVAKELIDLCKAGGFPLAKWHSNSSIFLKKISQSSTNQQQIDFEDCTTKILGLQWSSSNDSFTFISKAVNHESKYSKRLILSEVAQIYDPLGFVSPITIRAKMLLQDLWLHNLSWDEPIPQQIIKRWLLIREEFQQLNEITIPRWIHTSRHSVAELHGFSDASQLAMAAAIFIKVISPSAGPKITLVCAKTKVAPLKKITVPRLELTAALILAKLIKHVKATMNINIQSIHLWTDSTVVLSWIMSNAARWKEFVSNRVLQIQELVPYGHWHHISGKENPADCASRGISVSQFKDYSLWWKGPTWLADNQDCWPAQPKQVDGVCNLEARPGITLITTIQHPIIQWDLIHRFSDLKKLLRITAIIIKFISRLKKIKVKSPLSTLTAADLNTARVFWIKSTQAVYFQHELHTLSKNQTFSPNHVFNKLTAHIDQEGVLRVGGRLRFAQLDVEAKQQAIIPRHSPFTTLLIRQAHMNTLHGGTQLTLSTIRQQYWIIGGRAPVRSFILRCVECARQRGVRAQQLMGQLPQARVIPSRAFTHTGVDYAGPLTIKTWRGRGAKTQKAWICIFVCLCTSAVHIEVVGDYSTDGFIAAYRRFTSRRGICHTLYSDCGTNFVGANAELTRMFSQYTRENKIISQFITSSGTEWSFNPPAAPHMGGKWEAAVKSIKFHLSRTVKDSESFTFEEITTLLTQIEAILNSRPLEPLSEDPDDIQALTPGHFLTGSALNAIPEPSLLELSTTRLSRWQFIQQKMQQFWDSWSKSYLQRLQALSKWFHRNENINIGSLALLTDERLPPAKWPLVRIIKLHPGTDGLSRVATVKTSKTTLTRPITKLAILPIDFTPEDAITEVHSDNHQLGC